MNKEQYNRKAVFLDLQGTLGGEGLGDIRDFSFYPFAIQAIKLLNDNKMLAIAVTNQSHIAKGYFTYEQFKDKVGNLCHELTEHGARLDGVYCCPHRSQDGCTCHKPRPGLVLKAKEDFDLVLDKCYVIGDSGISDIGLAQAVGSKGILVMTGLGNYCRIVDRDRWLGIKPDYMTSDFLEAVRLILELEKQDSEV